MKTELQTVCILYFAFIRDCMLRLKSLPVGAPYQAQGMLEFEQTGQKRLEDAASAVHQRQCSSYASKTLPKSLSRAFAQNDSISSCEDQEAYVDDIDVDVLFEAHVSKPAAVKPMTTRDWGVVMKKVESYRNKLAKERCLYE
jgi:hypothetical protein